MHSRLEQGTMTEKLHYQDNFSRQISMRNVLRLISSFLLPLMLGIFTVVITLHQENVSQQQRLEDRQLSREQREQDLNISSLLRAQDKEGARLQREQDLTLAYQQREEDQRRRIQDLNISELQREEQRTQREQDLIIAHEKLIQEKNLTQEQHRIAERQRIHELDVEQKRYWDSILTDYIKEVGQLLREHNGSLTRDPLIATLVRIKTLTVVRQLSPVHNIQLLQFLYEAGQLTGEDSLDLSTAQLNNIDLSRSNIVLPLRNISLAGVRLINVSFDGSDLTGANFSRIYINNGSFLDVKLDFVQFSYSELCNIIINHTSGENVNFNSASMIDVHITNSNFRESLFQNASLLGVNIDNSEMYHSNFGECICSGIRVSDSKLQNVDFFKAVIDDGNFVHCELDQSNFVNTSAIRANFTHVSMESSNFSYCHMMEAKFSHIKANDADFSYADMQFVNCSSMTASSTTFFRANLLAATLIPLEATETNFSHTLMAYANLGSAILIMSSFVKADLYKAKLSAASTHRANFSLADLRYAEISNTQLSIAISIRGARLSNTIDGRNPNVIFNGDAKCNIALEESWKIENGSVFVKYIDKDNSDCIFTTNSTSGAYFAQRIFLFESKFSYLLQSRKAVLILTARFGNTTSIGLEWGDKVDAEKRTLNSSVDSLRWKNNVSLAFYVGVWVKFAPDATQDTNWCDDIFLDIDDGNAL